MKWSEMGLGMRIWWGVQFALLVVVLVSHPIMLGFVIALMGFSYWSRLDK